MDPTIQFIEPQIALTGASGPKKICVFMDGTNSTPKTNTHVHTLYKQVSSATDAQHNIVTFYDVGVGAAPPFLRGSVLGTGFTKNLAEAYLFVLDQYVPDRGDEVYLFGFSRGARQAQVLADMLYRKGIPSDLPAGDLRLAWGKEMIQEYQDYLAQRAVLENHLTDPEPGTTPVPVRFVGIFDSVESLAPNILDRLRDGKEKDYAPHDCYRYDLPPNVDIARHAIAMDEFRGAFEIIKWGQPAQHRPHQSVKEVWFSGSHGDVGGFRDYQSKWALAWMIEELADEGILPAKVDLGGPLRHERIHDSRFGIAGSIPGFQDYPRSEKFWLGTNHRGSNTHELSQPMVHISVLERMRFDPIPEFISSGDQVDVEQVRSGRELYRPLVLGNRQGIFGRSLDENGRTIGNDGYSFNFYPHPTQEGEQANSGYEAVNVDWNRLLEAVTIVPVNLAKLRRLGIEIEPTEISKQVAASTES